MKTLEPEPRTAGSSKRLAFLLEGLNSFGTTFYIYYLFFFLEKRFGFGDAQNLAMAALNGFVYIFGAWLGGRFGQRFGYRRALLTGCSIMGLALLSGAFLDTVPAQIAVLVVWTSGMCFTWPTLQALVSEGESPARLPRVIGIYNVIWAAVGGGAYFIGGTLLERFGLRSLFLIPVAIHLVQICLLTRLRQRTPGPVVRAAEWPEPGGPLPPLNPRPISRARTFLKIAWTANPFAYVAINTVVAVVPGIARELGLSPQSAGIFCSVWFFSRLGTFAGLWAWRGWHYRFRWFILAYLLLVVGFCCILMIPKLWVIVLAQIGFGAGLGLIYYSSLYYSMDVGEAKAEHGGFHEAAIGTGIFAGPAVGAAALHFFPDRPESGAVAVTILLLCGFCAVMFIQWKSLWARSGK